MSAFDTLFKFFRERKSVRNYFKMLNGYSPVFHNFDGGVYEMELTRSCIHAFASHCSKLQPKVTGADLRGLQQILDTKPNRFMTGSQFLYKAATIYEAKNTVYIMPIVNQYDETVGFYPADPAYVEIVTYGENPEPFLRFAFPSGDTVSFELSRVGIVSKYLYRSDLVGENNDALNPTMQLLSMQNQGISEGIKNSATFRFMANVNNFATAEDLKKERQEFVENNFGPDSGGLALFPNTYSNVKQVISTQRVVDPEQMKIIQERVYDYFGSNTDILQNKTVGDTWSAYYEGKIEPFAIQLSQAMTTMTYNPLELARGNAITWFANRIQYMTNTDKLQVSCQLFDRGIVSTNGVMDIWNMPHVPDGDKRYIRKEYINVDQIDKLNSEPEQPEPEQEKEPQAQQSGPPEQETPEGGEAE